MTEGLFIDPQGRLMPLRASTPEAFRVLVTRKIEQGWRCHIDSPVVAPLRHEETWAVEPPKPPAPVANIVNVAAPPLEEPSDDERFAAALDALGGHE